MTGFTPLGVLPGYRQAEMIFIPLGLFNIAYISQASVGRLLVPVICMAAMVPSAIPSSVLSGFRKILKTLFAEKRYCLSFIFECSVQMIFLSKTGNSKYMPLFYLIGDIDRYFDFILPGFHLERILSSAQADRRCY